MKRVNKKQMTGEQIFEYYRIRKTDYASIVMLLPYAVESLETVYKILEECERENKKLFAYYPGVDVLSPELMNRLESLEPIGSIIDGGMYIVPKEWKI